MSDKIKTVSIFIPAMNEEGNIEKLLEAIAEVIKEEVSYQFELIIVNDGSVDKTKLKLEEGQKKYDFLKVFHHRKNLGLTQAMKTGFKATKGDVILFLPADLESNPKEDIPKLLAKLEEGFDLVTGWRQGRGDGKILASKIYNTVSKYLFDVKVHDMNWIKGFRREVLEHLELRSDWHRFIVMMAANQGFSIAEVETNWYPRKAGKSKFGLMRFPKSMVDVLVVKFNMLFGTKPMQFFSLLGTVLIFIGFVMLGFLGFYYLLTETQKRPLFLVAVMCIIAGIQLFVTGFLSELIVSLKDEIAILKQKIKNYEKKEI